MSLTVQRIGVPWYTRDRYKRVLEVMEDRDVLPLTFDKWQRRAEDLERDQRRKGMTVVRAHLDPDEFVAWCSSRNLKVDSQARNRFAAEFAARGLVN